MLSQSLSMGIDVKIWREFVLKTGRFTLLFSHYYFCSSHPNLKGRLFTVDSSSSMYHLLKVLILKAVLMFIFIFISHSLVTSSSQKFSRASCIVFLTIRKVLTYHGVNHPLFTQSRCMGREKAQYPGKGLGSMKQGQPLVGGPMKTSRILEGPTYLGQTLVLDPIHCLKPNYYPSYHLLLE